ncbi:hypothetical protein R5R35_006303 [Gryllus longicercus]|uniref:Uncharacterized protein n=1 Tax=Gryllus longicercus TaxID=2509291 RepID=A0AAN9W138_9ORTH
MISLARGAGLALGQQCKCSLKCEERGGRLLKRTQTSCWETGGQDGPSNSAVARGDRDNRALVVSGATARPAAGEWNS